MIPAFEQTHDLETVLALWGGCSVYATSDAKRAAVAALEQVNFESGPQMGHKAEQRPVLAAVG